MHGLVKFAKSGPGADIGANMIFFDDLIRFFEFSDGGCIGLDRTATLFRFSGGAGFPGGFAAALAVGRNRERRY